MNTPVLAALAAAALFGASTPCAKAFLGTVPPVLLAGLLYAGSGIGLSLARLARDRGFEARRLLLAVSCAELCSRVPRERH